MSGFSDNGFPEANISFQKSFIQITNETDSKANEKKEETTEFINFRSDLGAKHPEIQNNFYI